MSIFGFDQTRTFRVDVLSIPPGQFYGDLIDDLFWVIVGAWLPYLRPQRIRRKVDRGEITNEDGETELRKLPPKVGYVLIIVGIGQMVIQLEQIGFFGESKLPVVLTLGISLGLVAFWMWQRRKSN